MAYIFLLGLFAAAIAFGFWLARGRVWGGG